MQPITQSKFLTDEERDRLVVSLEKEVSRDSLLLQLILYTGARGCEILALTALDFDLKGTPTVTIKAAKGSNNRTVPLPAKLGRALSQYIAGKDKPFAITTRQLRYIWDKWRPNPNKGIHALRHTAGVLLYLNCRDLFMVKALLGHKSISSSLVYLEYVLGAKELKTAMAGMWGKKALE
jgi:integrase